MRRAMMVVLLGTFLAGSASAQSDTTLKPGTWGVETSNAFGSDGLSAAVLRFTSPTRAWRLALSASYSHSDRQITSSNPTTNPQSLGDQDFFSIDTRIGIRGYRGGKDEHFRPFTTFSLIAGYSAANGRAWRAGAATELGAAWFFSPHVSLGGFGDLVAIYQDIRDDLNSSTFTSRETTLRFNGFRMLAAVYF